MSYQKLEEVTGIGKIITNRDKYSRIPFTVGLIQDELSVSDGEQKYFAQLIRLAEDVKCEGDPTRHIFRIGYYTRRTDGWFCLGSQYAPTLTPDELRRLVNAMCERGWLEPATAD